MASNVIWSSLFLGNLAEIDTDESTVAGENTGVLLTTFGSIGDPLYNHKVDVSTNSADGTMTSDNTGDVDTISYDLGSGTQVAEIDTGTFVNITITYADGSTATESVAIYQDTLGNAFLVAMDGQTALGVQGIRSITGNSIITSGSSDSQTNYDSVEFVCFAEGTLIMTPEGNRAVETLQPGDLVVTHDFGQQTIRWTRSNNPPLEGAADEDKPVEIKRGALGRNLPARDLVVSPQHRILVGGGGQLQQIFSTEAFVPAKSLTGIPGIRHIETTAGFTWVHFACDRHEVVTANGCLSETLLLGPMVVNGLSSSEREQVTNIFGVRARPDAALNGPPARKCLTVGAAKRQIAKHLKERARLLAKERLKWDRDLAMETYETERMRMATASAHAHNQAFGVA